MDERDSARFSRYREDVRGAWERYLTSKDLSEEFSNYRECIRHLWNSFLRHADEGETALREIDGVVLESLLLAGLPCKRLEGYLPKIAVRYDVPPKGFPVLFGTAEHGSVRWEERRLHQADAEFRFIELFDFLPGSGLARDFAFVKVRAVEIPEYPELRGADLLISATNALPVALT